MSETCATCAHWEPPSGRTGFGSALQIVPRGGYGQDADYAEARSAREASDLLYGECKRIELTEIEVGQPLPLATVRDGSDYRAILYSQAEFGCRMWEQGPENDE